METLWESLAVKRRHNLQIIFNFTSVIPFKWATKYMCFYCDKQFNESERSGLRKHTKYHGECFPDNYAIKQVVDARKSVKVDVSELSCELCNHNFIHLEELIQHINSAHDLDYVPNIDINLRPYKLNNLSCFNCEAVHNSFVQLVTHIKGNHSSQQLICDNCNQKFISIDNLEMHIVQFHNPGKYKCDLCILTYSTLEGLQYHKQFIHDSICEFCSQTFPTMKLKLQHTNVKHVTKYKCFACSKLFSTKNSLKTHTKKCYVLKGTNIEIKLLEDDVDVSKDVVKIMRNNMFHILNMSTIIPFKWFMNRFRCFYCKFDCNEPHELKEHCVTKHKYCNLKDLKRCKGEQGEVKVDISSIVCKECSSAFENLDTLIDHLVINHKLKYDKNAGTSFQEFKLNSKEMLCPFCSEKFTFFGNILKHIHENHFEKNFVCTYCGLFFCKEMNLRGHINNKHSLGVQCTICSAKLQNKSKLLLHMANNHGEKISKCSMCSESFTSPYIRAKHMVEKHNLEYKCKYCTKIFPKKSFLLKHIQRNHSNEIDDDTEASTSNMIDLKYIKKEPKPEQSELDPDLNYCETPMEIETPYVQKHTGQTSKRKTNMQLVLNMSTAIPFKWFLSSFRCFYCTKNFREPEELREHCSKEHFDYFDFKKALKRYKGENLTVKVDITKLSCRICSANMDNMEILIDHLISEHNAEYDKSLTDCFAPFRLVKDNMVCLICGQSFSFFGHLLIHHNDKHQSKDHICSYCGLAFSKFVNLRAHITNHHKEDSQVCTECNATFQTKPRLLTHMARYHGTKISKCRHCDETFTTPYQRSKHMVEKHDLEFRCPHCNKVFPKNSTMKSHVRRVHLREKNVQCDVCFDKFFDNALLRLHMVKHEGLRNFKCDYCGKAFLWLKNLRAHVKAHSKGLLTQNVC